MSASKWGLLYWITAFAMLCAFNTVECRRFRSQRSVDKATSDYVKVFSAYLGEIPMTEDIKRMEKNLPSDKKKKIYYLKKSQKFALWTAGRGGKGVHICAKRQELLPTAMSYIHGGEVVTAILPKTVQEKGLTLGQTLVTNKWADQLTDGIEVTFGKAVHIRDIQFLGKHNIVKVGVEYKYDKKWNVMKNQYNKLDWMVLQRDSRITLYVPKADVIRIYPQRFKGEKPIIYGLKFFGCI